VAVTNLGRPHSGRVREMEILSIPVSRARKQALEGEARASGCRSMAEFIRLKLDWPENTRRQEVRHTK